MYIITLTGKELRDLIEDITGHDYPPHTIRLAHDGNTVKVKIDEGVWSVGQPMAGEDARRLGMAER